MSAIEGSGNNAANEQSDLRDPGTVSGVAATDSQEPTKSGLPVTNGNAEQAGDGDSPKPLASPKAEPNLTMESSGAMDESGQSVDKHEPDSENAAEIKTTTADTPADSTKKLQKRRSSVGVPEHKNKKLNKKKSMPVLNLDAKPGDYYWARMRGFPPWPAIICDEEMLPETLLATRPVTAKRPDGSYRDDYDAGGKNEKDRTYPVMYLHTNEFSWTLNTDLTRLDLDEVKHAEPGKKGKQLWAAYEVAKQGHDLQYFKQLLLDHEEAIREEAAEKERVEAEKKEKAERKASRKSKETRDVDEDTVMEDAEGNASVKDKASAKKRKKDLESDPDSAKPTKTPKTKLKVTLSQTPNGSSSSKPKTKKAPESPKAKALTEAERKQKTQKEVLYFRHKLQKGFLSTDQAPKEEDMKHMADYFTSLEAHKELDTSIIRATKIHKVLKAILKLNSIPRDEEHNFKQRSMDLLQVWQKALADDMQTTTMPNRDASPHENGEEDRKDAKEGEPDMAETSSVTHAKDNEDLGGGASAVEEDPAVDNQANNAKDKTDDASMKLSKVDIASRESKQEEGTSGTTEQAAVPEVSQPST